MRWIASGSLICLASIASADVRSEALPAGFTGDIEVGFVARRIRFHVPTSVAARGMELPSESATIDGAGGRLRFVLGDADGFYVGADGDAVGGTTGSAMLMHGVMGWRHLFDRGLVSAELAAGGGIATYAVTQAEPQLVDDFEARVGVAHFVGSMVVVGTELGTNPFDRGEFSIGMMVGVLADKTHAWHGRH
ncbi:MAG TPA: hypothetical protein VGM90_33590 [Kofleriaceae bacterium]|jgi:hypothetical protein